MTSITIEATQAARREAARRRALEELLRARARSRGCTPARPSRMIEWIEERFAKQRAGARGEHSPRSRPATTSARPPSCSTTPTRSRPRSSPPGDVPQHHRQRRAVVRARRRRRSRRSCRSSTRRTRSRRRPTSCTSCRSTRTSACARCRPRTRSPPSASRSAPRSPASSASPTTSGPGVDLKSRGDRARDQPRAAAAHHRRAARRPVDRPADQDRAGRPAARDVRPPRRGAAADRRRDSAGALLRRRVRGGAHRARSTARR